MEKAQGVASNAPAAVVTSSIVPALPAPSLLHLRSTLEHKDYSDGSLRLKPDHAHKPFWVLPDLRIILESSSPVYKQAEALLIAIAEPVSRTRFLQEYQLTSYSLYAGASMGLLTEDILTALRRFSKTELPQATVDMVTTCTARYGKVALSPLHKGHSP